ncbi:hypothetical protein BH11ARM2_BH11ARM2_28390 [soil metagenome]
MNNGREESYDFPMAFPPGATIAEELEARGISENDFAEMIEETPAFVSDLLAGNQALTADVALRLEAALQVSALSWLNMEARYRALMTPRDEPLFERIRRRGELQMALGDSLSLRREEAMQRRTERTIVIAA